MPPPIDDKPRGSVFRWFVAAIVILLAVVAGGFALLPDDVYRPYDESHVAFEGPWQLGWEVLPDGRVVAGDKALWVLSADPPAIDGSTDSSWSAGFLVDRRLPGSPDGRFVVRALSWSEQVVVWDLVEETWTLVTFESERPTYLTAVAFPDDETLLVAVTDVADKRLLTYDLRDLTAPIASQGIVPLVTAMTVVSPTFVLTGDRPVMRITRRGNQWDISTFSESPSYQPPVVGGDNVVLFNYVEIQSGDGGTERRPQLEVVLLDDGSMVAQIVLPPDVVIQDYDALPDGRFVVTGSDGLVALFHPADPESSLQVYYRDSVLAGVRVGPNGEILFHIPLFEFGYPKWGLSEIGTIIERWTVEELEAEARQYRKHGCDAWSRDGDVFVIEAPCEVEE